MKLVNNKKLIILINALIFTIAFNTPILLQRYMNYKAAGDNAIYAALGEFCFAFAFVYPLLYSCSIQRLGFKILLIIIYVISGLAAYFVYRLNLLITPDIIAAFFESSRSEVLNLLNLELILSLICSGLLGWLCILSVNLAEFDRDQDKKLSFITIIFTLGCLFGDGDWVNNILPYNILKQSGTYWLEKAAVIEKRFDIAQNYKYEIDELASQDLNIVLIIGESARRDHFSLGGYKKDTNPLLAKEGSNLIYYDDVTACYPLTRVAVPCMITRATRDNRKLAAKETSFIGVFRKLGFYTTWLGMQGTYTAIDAPYFDLAKESHKALLLGTDVDMFSSNDSSLFPLVDQFYRDNPKGKSLLVLHTYGSHFHYEERYTDEFRKYVPICKKKKFLTDMMHCSMEERLNSYDNSILYTDYFIKSIIDRLRDKKALVIYTPDHGESMGEGGRFLHGSYNAGEQIAVSMLFWASDKYIKAYPENIKNLRKLQNESILHDHLFHSILGCSGIKSDIIENKLNLCRNKS